MEMLKWYGHVARKKDNRLPKGIMTRSPGGGGGRRRPEVGKGRWNGYKAEESNIRRRNNLATRATENQQPVDHWLLVVTRQRYIYRQTDRQIDKNIYTQLCLKETLLTHT